MMRTILFLIACSVFFVGMAGPLSGTAAAQAPRYYIHIRAVELGDSVGAASADSKVTREQESALAREKLLEALKKRSEVTMELTASPTDTAAVAAELKQRKLRGYELTLRLLKLERIVRPIPAGKKFPVLEQNIKLALVGTAIPGDVLALGGDGEATVQSEVGLQVSERQERDLLNDTMQDAIDQAINQALQKLKIGPMKPPKDPPRRKKPK